MSIRNMDAFNKRELSEQDIRTKFITPAIIQSDWDVMNQMREEVYFTAGRIIVRGKMVARGKAKKADYVLYHKANIPIAVVEAKDNTHTVGAGMQQALGYAEMLDVPFAFSSNGDGFIEHDRLNTLGAPERELPMDEFPSPEELWDRYCQAKGLTDQGPGDALAVRSTALVPMQSGPYTREDRLQMIRQDYYSDPSGKVPRYYQANAINRTIEAIASGQNRVLLVMATGTGKTFVAFQIIWRLWKSRRKKRILFLADRNILVDQTRNNDFKPFGSAMTKITNRTVDKSYEVYLALYQAVTGTEEFQNIYKEFSRDFFDLIIVDECHRGSAADDAVWHEILSYFSNATQIGMTATPKETKYVSNIHYFGEPIYTYSLKQGIEDGFLAPYKVVRIDMDKDLTGWRPPKGKVDKHGQEIEDRIYNQKDFDRTMVLEQRTDLVAKKVSEFLKLTDRYAKTIVFCEDIDHAERMRGAVVNENSDLTADNRRYVMRITGDNPEGKAELDNFIDPESIYPVIATTSKLMSTGVDAQTCKLVVLDKGINSMTEFKQIIGRGTRVREDYDKMYFTIIDFKKATELFSDPDFDGEPVQIYEPGPDDPPVPPDPPDDGGRVPDNGEPKGGEENGGVVFPEPPSEGRRKYYVKDVAVFVVAERVQYYDKDGKLITESLKDYTKKAVLKQFRSLDDFLRSWSGTERKDAIIKELAEEGLLLEPLAEEVGREFDAFDLICHVAFDQPPLTRKERANNVRKRDYFTRYGEKAQTVLNALLDKYADTGIENLEDMSVLQVPPINEHGTPVEIINSFGGREAYEDAIKDLAAELYRVA